MDVQLVSGYTPYLTDQLFPEYERPCSDSSLLLRLINCRFIIIIIIIIYSELFKDFPFPVLGLFSVF